MKVLHIIATADPRGGGPIEAVIQTDKPLRALGHRQEMLTLDGPDDPWVNSSPMPVHALGSPASAATSLIDRARRWSRYSPDALAWARRHMDDYDVVVVDGLWNFATHLARRTLVGGTVPYIVYTHGMLDPWFKRRYPLKHIAKQLLWLVNEGVLLRHADAVAYTNETERLLARRSFRPFRVRERVLRFGTADVPPATAEQAAAFRSALPSLKDRPYLLFLSRIHEKKGCDLLVEAFATVAAEHPEVDLVIAGPDQVGLQGGLMAMADHMGVGHRIHWPGMLVGDAKWGAFHGCQAFVLPSHQENFGIVVAEAMACRKPCLISDQVNIWREVEAGGGGLVAPDSLPGTRMLLDRFLTMDAADRIEMGARARATFLDQFEVGATAGDLAKLIDEVAERRGHPSRAA